MENNNVGEREVWGQGMGGIVRIDIEIKKAPIMNCCSLQLARLDQRFSAILGHSRCFREITSFPFFIVNDECKQVQINIALLLYFNKYKRNGYGQKSGVIVQKQGKRFGGMRWLWVIFNFHHVESSSNIVLMAPGKLWDWKCGEVGKYIRLVWLELRLVLGLGL